MRRGRLRGRTASPPSTIHMADSKAAPTLSLIYMWSLSQTGAATHGQRQGRVGLTSYLTPRSDSEPILPHRESIMLAQTPVYRWIGGSLSVSGHIEATRHPRSAAIPAHTVPRDGTKTVPPWSHDLRRIAKLSEPTVSLYMIHDHLHK